MDGLIDIIKSIVFLVIITIIYSISDNAKEREKPWKQDDTEQIPINYK